MNDEDMPNDEQPMLPTVFIQFDDGNGLPIDVDPSTIAGTLIPILAQIAEANSVGVNVSYGLKSRASFNTLGEALENGED